MEIRTEKEKKENIDWLENKTQKRGVVMSEVWNMKISCTLISRKKKSLLAMRNHTKLYGFILLFLLVSDLDFSLMKKKKKKQ